MKIEAQSEQLTPAEEPSNSSSRQIAPEGHGEHKSLTEHELVPSHQLSTDQAPEDREAVDQAAMAMLKSPGFHRRIVEDVQKLGVVREENLILILYFVATGRLLDKPIPLCIYGHSSSGKSFIVNSVLDLIPSDEATRTTQLTPKYLLNLPKEEAEKHRHKVIFIGELTSTEGDLCFREMVESGELRSLTVRQNKSEESHAYGPVTFIMTTTQDPSSIKDEDASRTFYATTDDSPEQTARVMQARSARAKESRPVSCRDEIRNRHWAAQALLAQRVDVDIRIPYADLVQLPPDRPEHRRLHDMILLLLKAVTFMGQFRDGRRSEESEGCRIIYADHEDWRIALPLVRMLLDQKLGVIDADGRAFIEKVRPAGTGPLSLMQLAKLCGLSESTVRRRISNLPKNAYLSCRDGKKDVYRFYFDDEIATELPLPSPDDVREFLRIGGKLGSCPNYSIGNELCVPSDLESNGEVKSKEARRPGECK